MMMNVQDDDHLPTNFTPENVIAVWNVIVDCRQTINDILMLWDYHIEHISEFCHKK